MLLLFRQKRKKVVMSNDVSKFIALILRHKPEAINVSGFNTCRMTQIFMLKYQ